MGAARVCDRRMSSGHHFYARLTLVISRYSECMEFDSYPQRLQLPLDRYNLHCRTVSAGCRESSLSRVESRSQCKGGRTTRLLTHTRGGVIGLRITSERLERVTAEFCGWRL